MSPKKTKAKLSFNEKLGKTLINLAAKKQTSLERVAYEAGVSKGYIYDIAKGRANPTLKTLKKITTILEIPLWKLIKMIDID